MEKTYDTEITGIYFNTRASEADTLSSWAIHPCWRIFKQEFLLPKCYLLLITQPHFTLPLYLTHQIIYHWAPVWS